jgi:hypothetical protein
MLDYATAIRQLPVCDNLWRFGALAKVLIIPRQVSPWFRFDWQYVLATGRLPALKPVAVVLAVAPVVGNLTQVVAIGTTGFWLIWAASVTSLIAFGVTRLRCPAFVREYETYEDYSKKGHSHRWIIWSFYLNRFEYSSIDYIIRETISKGLSHSANAIEDVKLLASTPVMSTPPHAGVSIEIMSPLNANRDLYIGFWLEGARYILTIQEDDPKRDEKTRELFWLILSDLLSSRRKSRIIIWAIYGVTLTLSGIALMMNLAKPVQSAIAASPPILDRLIAAVLMLIGYGA